MPFTAATLTFFRGLARHNAKPWFEAHRADYEQEVVAPMRALIEEMDVRLARFAPEITGHPKRSMFRIYRDVRFSKDKSPYKTNVAASFPWVEGGDSEGPHGFGESGNPGGYFHLSPGEVYIGGGMWHPPTAKLVSFRKAVVDDPSGVRRLLEEPEFVSQFGALSGDKLKRVPPGFPPDHPEAELLKHKDFTFGRRLADRDVMSPGLPEVIAESFEVALPVVRFLARLPG